MPPPPPGSTPSGPPAQHRPGSAAEPPPPIRARRRPVAGAPRDGDERARSTAPPAVVGVRCWPPGPGDAIVTAMTGGQAAGSGLGADPGTCGEGDAWGMLHVLADYHLSEGGLCAVCRCGHTGPPRAAEARAAAALDAQ